MITYGALGRNGNTGNSMFQYATLLSVGITKGYEVKIPHHPTYFDTNYNSNNCSIFDGFDIKTPLLLPGEQPRNDYNEKTFSYDPGVMEIPDNTNLKGYFQTERYFTSNREPILAALQFKWEIRSMAETLFELQGIKPGQCTSIHVRRGDFVRQPNFHPQCGPEYFAEAAKLAKSEKYLIFSDDIKWCREAFGSDKNIHYSDNTNPFVDMCAMSMCAHHIIVNSTFGWWGAWLNTNPDKIVVAPKVWLGPGYAPPYADPVFWNTSDVVPSTWIKI